MNISQEIKDRLLAGVEKQREPTRAWKPDEGDRLVGQVVRRSRESTDRGGEVDVLYIQTEDDDAVPIWCGCRMLKDLVRDKNPQPGDYIVIVYFGERETRDGRNYKHYGMTVIRPGSPVTTDAARVTPVAVNGGSTEGLGITDADVPF